MNSPLAYIKFIYILFFYVPSLNPKRGEDFLMINIYLRNRQGIKFINLFNNFYNIIYYFFIVKSYYFIISYFLNMAIIFFLLLLIVSLIPVIIFLHYFLIHLGLNAEGVFN